MGGLYKDPAIEKFVKMRETTHLYFRMTPKISAILFGGLVVFPALLYYGIKKGEVRQGCRSCKVRRRTLTNCCCVNKYNV